MYRNRFERYMGELTARLLRHSLSRRWAVPEGTGWVNYIRCHDDIGWTFSDEDAREAGIDGFEHRKFLNRFYTGRFERNNFV